MRISDWSSDVCSSDLLFSESYAVFTKANLSCCDICPLTSCKLRFSFYALEGGLMQMHDGSSTRWRKGSDRRCGANWSWGDRPGHCQRTGELWTCSVHSGQN